MIATGYSLPFEFRHSEPSAMVGRPLAIRVRTGLPDPEGLVVVALRLFEQLAHTGALGGGRSPPWNCALVLAQQAGRDDTEVLFRADPCRLSDEAWVVLCHLLLRLHERLPIQSVDVLAAGDAAPRVLLSDAPDSTYPRAVEPLPYALDDHDPEGGGYSFFIRLEAPLTAEHESRLNGWLETWTQAVQAGGYAMAPLDPATDYVERYGSGVVSYERVIEWSVFKLSADPLAAIDALKNLFACFHARCQSIQSIEIG